jgi:hypothetical protein
MSIEKMNQKQGPQKSTPIWESVNLLFSNAPLRTSYPFSGALQWRVVCELLLVYPIAVLHDFRFCD